MAKYDTFAQNLGNTDYTQAPNPQEFLPGRESEMGVNYAGGTGFLLPDEAVIYRMITLGTSRAQYHASAKKMTADAMASLTKVLTQDKLHSKEGAAKVGKLVVDAVCNGEVFRKDAPMFVLACIAAQNGPEARAEAFDALLQIVGTPYDIMLFQHYYRKMGGKSNTQWRRMVQTWLNSYKDKPADFTFHALKYQQREGVSLASLIDFSHAKPASPVMEAAYKTVLKGYNPELGYSGPGEHLSLFGVVDALNKIESEKEAIKIIQDNHLAWEMVPSRWLSKPDVWRALLPNLGIAALSRNLNRLTALGVLGRNSDELDYVTDRFGDKTSWGKNPVHPFRMLLTWNAYRSGRSMQLQWTPLPKLVESLASAFYLSFDLLPVQKDHLLLAVDTSGSMLQHSVDAVNMRAGEVAAVSAMVIARQFPNSDIIRFNDGCTELHIGPNMSLDAALQVVSENLGGNTDPGAAMRWADANSVRAYKSVVMITDGQAWAGHTHFQAALKAYRMKRSVNTRLVVNNLVFDRVSIVDSLDKAQLEIVGFNGGMLKAITSFVAPRSAVPFVDDDEVGD